MDAPDLRAAPLATRETPWPWLSKLLPRDPRNISASVAIFITTLVVVPRFPTIMFLAVAAVWVIAAAVTQKACSGDWPRLPQPDFLTWATVGFFAIFIAGCAWSVAPADGLEKALLLTTLCITFTVLAHQSSQLDRTTLDAIARGLVAGMVVVSAYVIIETITSRELNRLLHTWLPQLRDGFEKHFPLNEAGEVTRTSHSAFNRSTGAYTMLLVPTLLAARVTLPKPRFLGVVAVFCATMIAILWKSTHQSSQLAILLGLCGLAAAYLSQKWTRAALAAALCGLSLLIVPFSLFAKQQDLLTASWIMNTGKARLIFWAYTSERVLERPLLGVGTYSTKYIDERRPRPLDRPDGYVVPPRTSIHPHNVLMQIWYEVGLVGALLTTLFGLALLWRASSIPAALAPFALAQYLVVLSLITPSYGLWQVWFQTLIAMSILAIVISVRRYQTGQP